MNQILKDLDRELTSSDSESSEESYSGEQSRKRKKRLNIANVKTPIKIMRVSESLESGTLESAVINKDEARIEQDKAHMVAAENPVNRLLVKESSIPIDALYNEHVNA